MKKIYQAPTLEIDAYELNASIASNCSTQINAGPQDPVYQEGECSDWKELEGDVFSARSAVMPQNFWTAETCDCSLSATNAGYFTS